jgi:hypothetical protein
MNGNRRWGSAAAEVDENAINDLTKIKLSPQTAHPPNHNVPDLEAELLSATQCAQHRCVARMLEDLRVSPKLVAIVGIWGGVEFFGPAHAYWQPCEGGAFALIVGVVEAGDLVDLAAIELPTQHVATRLGFGRALGFDTIDRVRWNGGVLRLVEKPLDWLRIPDGAAFIINWRAAAFTLADLDQPVTTLATERIEVRCSSLALGERIERAFRCPLGMPNLRVAA